MEIERLKRGMESFYLGDDRKRLYFRNLERRSDDEEYAEIVSILKGKGCIIGNAVMGPDCDLVHCNYEEIEFDIVRTIDGDGSFIYCDDETTMKQIEKFFG